MLRSVTALWVLFSLALTALTARAEASLPPDEGARARDASIDRGLLTSHAETLGEGLWSINSYELFMLGVTYGITDDVQVNVTTSLPVVEDMPLWLILSGKAVLYRDPMTVVAARAHFMYMTSLSDSDDDAIGVFGAALLVDRYLDGRGRFAVHAGLGVHGAFGVGFDGAGVSVGHGAAFTLEGGFSLGLSRNVKLLVELQVPAASNGHDFEFAPFSLLNYGVRFHGGELAADLGFARPLGTDDDPFVLGFPFVAFSARF